MARSNNTSRIQIPRGAQSAHGVYNRASSRGQNGTNNKIVRGGSLHPSQGSQNFGRKIPKRHSIKKRIFIGLAVVLLVFTALIGADFALNNGKIHYGVKVEGIDIGGKSKSEATAELQAKLNSKLAAHSVQAQPDVATEQRLASRAVEGDGAAPTSGEESTSQVSLDGIVANEAGSDTAATAQNSNHSASVSWSFNAADLGVSIDAQALVEEAYRVGQVNGPLDFFSALAARFSSWFGQIDLSTSLIFDEEALAAALAPVNNTIGIQMINSTISINPDGLASVQTGQIGEVVNEEKFKELAQAALLEDSAQTVNVPLSPVPLDIDDREAQVVADAVNVAIAQPVNFFYETNSWVAGSPLLGSWVTAKVEGKGDAAVLLPSINASVAYEGIQQLMGDAGYGSAQNAHIDVSSGVPVIVGGTKGIGPDINAAVNDLQNTLFGANSAVRDITFSTAEVEPAVTAEQVASQGISELITSFTLGYGSGGGSNREFNIERCLNTLNGSVVAPGQNWNWNDVVGLCDTSTGYKEAGAINEKNELVQEPGGGICNVATGVFNAAYEAGLPILERANHSQYMSNYPEGRDAAVSWTYPTLSFQNDTDHYILITASYDGANMVISIWGTNPKRTVESRNSEWGADAEGGRTITNYRTVHAADGSVWLSDSFYSYFPPKKEGTAASA